MNPLQLTSQAVFWQVDTLRRGELILPKTWQVIVNSPLVPSRLARESLSLAGQEKAWEHVREFKEKRTSGLANLEDLAARLFAVPAPVARVVAGEAAALASLAFFQSGGRAVTEARDWERLYRDHLAPLGLNLALALNALATLPLDPPFTPLRKLMEIRDAVRNCEDSFGRFLATVGLGSSLADLLQRKRNWSRRPSPPGSTTSCWTACVLTCGRTCWPGWRTGSPAAR